MVLLTRLEEVALQYDVIIRGGIILDGTGSPPFRADIGVRGDTIIKIGDLSGAQAEVVVDASELYVSPGFIDIHNHSDVSIFAVPTADNYVLQGVTTIVVGNCGSSPAPLTELNRELVERYKKLYPEVNINWKSFPEYLDKLDSLPKKINVAPLVGFGAVRSSVLGFDDVKPTPSQLAEMKEAVDEAMRSGAFGLSTGLIYTPQDYADTSEIIELCKVVARYGGIYSTHMRNEGIRLIDSVMEAVSIGLASGCPVEISHLKAVGKPAWGLVRKALDLIEYYASLGYDVSADVYPYTATSTSLSIVLPPRLREGGAAKLAERLANLRSLDELRTEIEKAWRSTGRVLEWSQVAVALSPSHPEVEGMTVAEIARSWGVDPVEVVVKLLVDDKGLTSAVYHTLREDDVIEAIKSPYTAIGSDGSIRRYGKGKPHPRSYGTFPRVIARYVRELKVISLPEAMRKMTSLPARKMRLWDRGILRPGMKADIVVFDYYRIHDTATFENPHSYPVGIEYVIVNGKLAVEDGEPTKNMSGRLLRRTVPA
ncbi:MAG: D-aminoacylase [Thermoproteota archaeon]